MSSVCSLFCVYRFTSLWGSDTQVLFFLTRVVLQGLGTSTEGPRTDDSGYTFIGVRLGLSFDLVAYVHFDLKTQVDSGDRRGNEDYDHQNVYSVSN